jgi:hypothetical protein
LQVHAVALDSSLRSNYSESSTIQELVNNLMVEEWNTSLMYQHYYDECQPRQCTYTIKTKNELIYIATTLFGIAGGLTTVLELVVPRLVQLIMYCIGKLRRRVAPQVSIVQT